MALPRAQELNQRISFMSPSGSINAGKRLAESSTFYASAYARITEGTGSVTNEDQQHQSQSQEFEIWTRYIVGITAFMEIQWGTRTLTIADTPQKVLDKHNRPWLLIRAEEVIERSL
jgi:head-tail adaptor